MGAQGCNRLSRISRGAPFSLALVKFQLSLLAFSHSPTQLN